MMRLSPAPEAAAEGRHYVREVIDPHIPRSQREEIELVATELVTNAVRHARTDLEVEVRVTDDHISVQVTDEGPGDPQPARASGYGLLLVQHLADGWGVERHPACKTVWAIFRRRT